MCMKILWTQGERNDTNAQLGRLYVAKSPTVSLARQSSETQFDLYFGDFKGTLNFKKKKKRWKINKNGLS